MPTAHEDELRRNAQVMADIQRERDEIFWALYAATPKTDAPHYNVWCDMVQEFIYQHTGEVLKVKHHTVGVLVLLIREGKVDIDEVLGLAGTWKVAFT